MRTLTHSARLACVATLALAAGLANADGRSLPLRLTLALDHPTGTGDSAASLAVEDAIQTATRYRQRGEDRCSQTDRDWSQRLDLAQVLQLALCRSPSLRSALARIDEQAAEVDRLDRGAAPTWQLDLRYGADALRADGRRQPSTTSWESSLVVSWVLLDFGQQSAGLQAARLELQAAMAAERGEWQASLQQTLERFTAAVVAWANLDATREAEAVALRTANIAQARHAAQVGSQIERLQAQTALAQAQLERIQAQGEWENARSVLALSLGASVDQHLQLSGWTSDVLQHDNAQVQADSMTGILAQHPRLQSLQARQMASDQRLAALRAASRGNVVLEASSGRAQDRTGSISESRTQASAALRATVPLFAGGLTKAQERQFVAQRSGIDAELDGLALELAAELWQAQQAMINSRQARDASDRLLETAKQARAVAEGRYRAGVGSMLELLGAQTAQVDAQRQQALARADTLRQQVRFLVASGRLGR